MKTSKLFQKAIEKIAAANGVDLTKVGSYIRIEKPNYQPLNIETIGTNLVAVSHTYIQNGDVMRDPEMVFYTGYGEGGWVAISWQNDGIGRLIESVKMKDGKPGSFYPKVQADQASFAAMWARNLKAQGFTTTTPTTVKNGNE